jgi:hypothetical protein
MGTSAEMVIAATRNGYFAVYQLVQGYSPAGKTRPLAEAASALLPVQLADDRE